MTARVLGLLLTCAALALAAPTTLAHEGGDDVSWSELSGSQSGGEATVTVEVAELAVCEALEPLRLDGVRAERQVTGTLGRIDTCRFDGTIALPEPGRWMVGARFAYDGREAEVWLPVAVTDTAQTFERADWLHAVGEPQSGWTGGRTLLLALAGLLAGGLLTIAYRRLRPGVSDRRPS
ncbi:MAG: hypothetical protein ACRD1H_00855 [Vicinamibacterales bacterium]